MFRDVLRSKVGMAGVVIFTALAITAIVVQVLFPANFGRNIWSNPSQWADYPKAAEPQWTSYFDDSKIPHQIIEKTSPTDEITDEYGKTLEYDFSMKLASDDPTFLSFSVWGVEFDKTSPIIDVFLQEGDERVRLYRHVVPGKTAGETSPVRRYNEKTPLKVQLTSDFSVESKVAQHLAYLRGRGADEFTATVRFTFEEQSGSVDNVQFVAGGDVYGWSGTDDTGRDVMQGLLAGVKTALLVGVIVALLRTLIGAVMGAVSGYFGGKVESFIEGLIDVMTTVPTLPIVIFLVFAFGPKLSLIVLFLVVFGWTGLAIQIRPWIKQIRESGFISMARARGFSGARVILRHLLPQTLPFLFASFVLAMPRAILAEAALSFLGLGDPSLPTWGAMLKEGFQTGAINLGYWWWVLPPGLAIVITSLTGALVFYPLEEYAEPRLKRE